ncbi:hypothetical protein D3C85_1790740 [compost metagenome]
MQGRLIVAEQRVSLNHLGATRVTGDDDLFHIGKLLAIAKARDDFIECCVGTEGEWTCG